MTFSLPTGVLPLPLTVLFLFFSLAEPELTERLEEAKTDCSQSKALLPFPLAVLICNNFLYSGNLSVSSFSGLAVRRPYVAVCSSLLLELLGLFCSLCLMMETTQVETSYQTTHAPCLFSCTKEVTFSECNVIFMISKNESLIYNASPLNTEKPASGL